MSKGVGSLRGYLFFHLGYPTKKLSISVLSRRDKNVISSCKKNNGFKGFASEEGKCPSFSLMDSHVSSCYQSSGKTQVSLVRLLRKKSVCKSRLHETYTFSRELCKVMLIKYLGFYDLLQALLTGSPSLRHFVKVYIRTHVCLCELISDPLLRNMYIMCIPPCRVLMAGLFLTAQYSPAPIPTSLLLRASYWSNPFNRTKVYGFNNTRFTRVTLSNIFLFLEMDHILHPDLGLLPWKGESEQEFLFALFFSNAGMKRWEIRQDYGCIYWVAVEQSFPGTEPKKCHWGGSAHTTGALPPRASAHDWLVTEILQ